MRVVDDEGTEEEIMNGFVDWDKQFEIYLKCSKNPLKYLKQRKDKFHASFKINWLLCREWMVVSEKGSRGVT